ncbi:MAG: LTA synthase family protein, partial [Eggerthellaceae bacterium]|nr:LTA synthase family protein [Eggerthellaceae bacterium]
TKDSYAQEGATICFLKRVQDLTPTVPDGYSAKAATEILQQASQIDMSDMEIDYDSVEDMPSVVVVMNETFADLSVYGCTDNDPEYLQDYYDVAAEAIEAGTAYASTFAGGTCNSEFEFLTGSTLGLIGGSTYPYMMYDFSNVGSLVSYFNDLGYATHAVHSEAGTNWRRDIVYDELGFDDFADEEVFSDCTRLRDRVLDHDTYDYVLDLLSQSDDPQFIFDVTAQNHGPYDMGTFIGTDDEVHVTLPFGGEWDMVNEYASLIQMSAEDIRAFTNELNELDKPVVLCFFGDHQPSGADWIFNGLYGEDYS